MYVAPRVGAWIETCIMAIGIWMCLSHPVWVRGLKLLISKPANMNDNVAPRVGAWIETNFVCKS